MSERVPMQPVAGLSRTANIPPPPRRPSPRVVDDALPATTPVVEPAPTPTMAKAPARKRVSDQADVMRSTTLSLPVDVLQALKARAAADRVSQPEVLMDALSATHGQLEQLIQAENPPQSDDGLFVRRAAPESKPLGTLSLRMLSRNVDAIDAIATTSGAKSRSAVCTAALRTYLNA